MYYDPNGGTSANIPDPEENDYTGYHSTEDEVAIEEFEKVKAPDPFVVPDHAVTLYAV